MFRLHLWFWFYSSISTSNVYAGETVTWYRIWIDKISALKSRPQLQVHKPQHVLWRQMLEIRSLGHPHGSNLQILDHGPTRPLSVNPVTGEKNYARHPSQLSQQKSWPLRRRSRVQLMASSSKTGRLDRITIRSSSRQLSRRTGSSHTKSFSRKSSPLACADLLRPLHMAPPILLLSLVF